MARFVEARLPGGEQVEDCVKVPYREANCCSTVEDYSRGDSYGHLNPAVGGLCRICGMIENLEHLFLKFKRLKGLFDLLKRWVQAFDEEFSEGVFIWGVMYRFVIRRKA